MLLIIVSSVAFSFRPNYGTVIATGLVNGDVLLSQLLDLVCFHQVALRDLGFLAHRCCCEVCFQEDFRSLFNFNEIIKIPIIWQGFCEGMMLPGYKYVDSDAVAQLRCWIRLVCSCGSGRWHYLSNDFGGIRFWDDLLPAKQIWRELVLLQPFPVVDCAKFCLRDPRVINPIPLPSNPGDIDIVPFSRSISTVQNDAAQSISRGIHLLFGIDKTCHVDLFRNDDLLHVLLLMTVEAHQ